MFIQDSSQYYYDVIIETFDGNAFQLYHRENCSIKENYILIHRIIDKTSTIIRHPNGIKTECLGEILPYLDDADVVSIFQENPSTNMQEILDMSKISAKTIKRVVTLFCGISSDSEPFTYIHEYDDNILCELLSNMGRAHELRKLQ